MHKLRLPNLYTNPLPMYIQVYYSALCCKVRVRVPLEVTPRVDVRDQCGFEDSGFRVRALGIHRFKV